MHPIRTLLTLLIFTGISFTQVSRAYSQSKIESLIGQLDTCTNDTQSGKLCHKVSLQYYSRDKVKSIDYANKSLSFYTKAQYPKGQGLALQMLGFNHMYLGDAEKGLIYFQKSIDVLMKCKSYKSAVVCYSGASYCLEMQGKLEEALTMVLVSLDLIEKHQIGDKQKAKQLVDLGRIYRMNTQFDKSILTYKEALSLSKSAKDHETSGILLMNIGNVYLEKGDFGSAVTHYQNSLNEMDACNCHSKKGLLWRNIGMTQYRLGNKEKLKEATRNAEQLLMEKEDLLGKMDIIVLHGMYAQMNKDHKGAVIHLEKALNLAKEANVVEKITQISTLIKDSYEALGQSDKVNEALESAMFIKDSFYNSEMAKSMAEMQVKYETEKKQRELEISNLENKLKEEQLDSEKSKGFKLKLLLFISTVLALFSFALFRKSLKSKQVISEKNKELDVNLKQNSLLLKEIHHRVKNNLQTVSSLLNLQTRATHNEVVKEAILDGQSRLKSISLLHQKLYQQDSLEKIDMHSYIEDLSEYIIKNFNFKDKNVSLKIKVEDIELDMNTAMPLGLIINELITNSLKHSFKNLEEGSIDLELKATDEDNGYVLILRDNGPGLPDGLIIDNLSSMGLKLVSSLSRQIYGTFQTFKDKRANFVVRFIEKIQYD